MMDTGIRNKESISNRMLHVLLQNERCLLLSIKKESLYYFNFSSDLALRHLCMYFLPSIPFIPSFIPSIASFII